MALKPTIYKAQVNLADSDNNNFEDLSLIVAKHPSETIERMTVRLLAYCLNNTRGLDFTKGLSTADEPDIWQPSTWWKLNGEAISALPRVQVWQFPWPEVEAASALMNRTMKLGLSIVGGTLYLDDGTDSVALEPALLFSAE